MLSVPLAGQRLLCWLHDVFRFAGSLLTLLVFSILFVLFGVFLKGKKHPLLTLLETKAKSYEYFKT